ncbi:MAG: hypothetical protein J6A58_12645 [Oscillospiraceae bacterium]|nr:hypothetical protein [Oscillospiraceae bacterium]
MASSGDVVCQYFNRSRSEGVVSIGKAYAQVSYKFYNSLIPVQSSSGKFKITCSDEGTISDNGN